MDFLDPEQKDHDSAVAWMDEQGDEALATPAICAFEVLRGTARVNDERFERAVGFLRTLDVLEFGLQDAIAAGNLDGRLHEEGTPLSARDTLVASPAREHGFALVTRDRDFGDIQGLEVEFYGNQ